MTKNEWEMTTDEWWPMTILSDEWWPMTGVWWLLMDKWWRMTNEWWMMSNEYWLTKKWLMNNDSSTMTEEWMMKIKTSMMKATRKDQTRGAKKLKTNMHEWTKEWTKEGRKEWMMSDDGGNFSSKNGSISFFAHGWLPVALLPPSLAP